MKKINILTLFSTTALAAAVLVSGCQKEQKSPELTPQQEEQAAVYSSESEAETQAVFEDVSDNVLGVDDEVGIGGTGIFGRVDISGRVARVDSMPRCVTVSITPVQRNVFPKTVVMDFGSGCRINGRMRSGKITTVYTGRLIEPGKSATTTFENYKIDSIAVEGTHKLTNSTTSGSNQRQFTINVTDAKLTRPNGNYEEWSATRVHTQIEGNGTIPPVDDVFRITGNSRGKTKRGSVLVSWASEITEPLIKKFTCRWISKGIIKTVRNGLPSSTQWVGTLHFGNGTCDNKAVLVVNGKEHQIVLK